MEIEGIENLEERNENERKAIEFVIEEEIKENRKIKITDKYAHYDIESIGENDIRYIEVKTHQVIEFKALFSKTQIDFMEKNKDKYWLYLVYNLEIGKPSILKIKNPIENMLIRTVFEGKMYCLYLDKELKKIYSKDISKGIIGENEKVNLNEAKLEIDKIEKYKIDEIVCLKNFRKFLIKIYFLLKKRNDIIKIILEDGRLIKSKNISRNLFENIIKEWNLKEIEYISKDDFLNFRFIKIDEKLGRLFGNFPLEIIEELRHSNVFIRKIEEIIKEKGIEKIKEIRKDKKIEKYKKLGKRILEKIESDKNDINRL